MSLIVTGSIGIDTISSPNGHTEANVVGGSAVYFALAASFFTDVRVIGAVGDDFDDSMLAPLERDNICLTGIEKRQGSQTFRWHGKYLDNMNDRETVDVQINILAEAYPPVPQTYRDSEHVFLANTHPAAQLKLLHEFPNRRLAVADTMDLWIDIAKPELLALLKEVDGFVLNDFEALQLTNHRNVLLAAQAILNLGPSFVIIKRGEHGAILKHKNGTVLNLPAYPTERVIDPTGAGDTFAAGFMGYLAQTPHITGKELGKAMAAGTVIASYTLEDYSIKRLTEIDITNLTDRLDAYKRMLRID